MKNLSLLVLIFLNAGLLRAQVTPAPAPVTKDFRAGIRVSPFVGWTKDDVDNPQTQKIQNVGAKLGFSYGIMGEYFFAKNYGFAAEVKVAYYGGAFKYTPNSLRDSTVRVRMQYIEIPLTLKMRTNEVGYAKYFAQFGIVPAVNIKAKMDVTKTIVDPSGNTSTDYLGLNAGDYTNLFTASLYIGAGMEYNLGGNTSIVGSINWNNGFTNLWKRDDASKYDVKPSYIALNVGVLF
jgi:hypothetical protein